MKLTWLAALIDGEGTIMLVRHAWGAKAIAARPSLANTTGMRPRVGVYNTDVRLMDALMDRIGMGRVYKHRLPEHRNHCKVAYEWRVNSEECRILLPKVLPYLVLKQDRARLLVEALKLKTIMRPIPGKKWRYPSNESRAPFVARIAQIAAEINLLNKKNRRP